MARRIITVTPTWLTRRRNTEQKVKTENETRRGAHRRSRVPYTKCAHCHRTPEPGERVVCANTGTRNHSFRCMPCAIKLHVITRQEAKEI